MSKLAIIGVISVFIIGSIATLPEGWSSLGCWSDNTNARALSAASYLDASFSTQEACITFCDERNYPIAGAEFGRECYCDNVLQNNSTQTELGDCNVPCPFNSSEDCGGSNRLNVFTKSRGPAVVQQFSGTLPGVWNLLGTFNNTTPDSQPFAVEAIIAMTPTTSGSIENCLTWCFTHFGCPLCSVSDGGVCECGNTLSPGRVESNHVGQVICQRNSSEICGDTGVWQVYEFTPN